jgi:hypothetical protein
VTTAQHCGNCGTALTPGAPFCPNCGTRVEAAAPLQPPVYATPTYPVRAQHSTTFYLAVGAVIAVVGVVAALMLLGGGGGSGSSASQASTNKNPSSGGQPQTGTTPVATATPRPVNTPAPVASPTPVRLAFDLTRADVQTVQVLNGAARIRGPGAEQTRNTDRTNLIVFSSNFDSGSRPECAPVAQHAKDLATGRKGGAFTTFYRRDQGPGAGVAGNTAGVGVYGENASAEVHVYETAAQVTANLERVRAMIARQDFLNCEKVQATSPYTVVPSTIPAGPGGLTYAHDESYNTTRGRVSYRVEEYAWQVDNLLVRVTFTGAPGTFITAGRVQDNLGAISEAIRTVSGR